MKRQRLSVVGGACAVVLISAAVAAATVGSNGRNRISIAGGSRPTTTPPPSASASTTLPYDSSSAAPTSDGASYPTTPGAGTEPAALQPQDGSWSVSMSVDAMPVIVGDLVTVRVDLRNTGTQPQQTSGDYGSLAVTCESTIMSHFSVDSAPGWPIGQFLEPVIMVPGESRSFSMTFRVEEVPFSGGANCNFGLASHVDAPYVHQFPGLEIDSVPIVIVIVPAPDGSTTASTTDTVPTTTTTITP